MKAIFQAARRGLPLLALAGLIQAAPALADLPIETLGEAIVSMGFAKSAGSLNQMLPVFGELVHQVRKIRLMGSAALALTYVADGRFDGYIEAGIRLWDVAAGGLILQRAGGRFEINALPGEDYKYSLNSNNGHIHDGLARIAAGAIRQTPPSRKKKA